MYAISVKDAASWLRDYVTAIKHGQFHPYTPLERKVREATRNEAWYVEMGGLKPHYWVLFAFLFLGQVLACRLTWDMRAGVVSEHMTIHHCRTSLSLARPGLNELPFERRSSVLRWVGALDRGARLLCHCPRVCDLQVLVVERCLTLSFRVTHAGAQPAHS